MGREIRCAWISSPMIRGQFHRSVTGCLLWKVFPARSIAIILGAVMLSSCTLLTHSPYLAAKSRVAMMRAEDRLATDSCGHVPYQRWRVPPWSEDMRFIWVVGNYDFRRHNDVELVFYFHGMHSKDYYRAFRKELLELAKKRNKDPFLFVGVVDTPFVSSKERSKHRWKAISEPAGERPDKLVSTVNWVFRAFKRSFPHVKKRKTRIVLAGFSGGGRVLDSVGRWLAASPPEDPYARAFRSKLSKIVYFDCWFNPKVLEIVPALLRGNPSMKIVGTVHMKSPKKHADLLAGKFKMKKRKSKNHLTGLNGRLIIFRNKSHWGAMIARLTQALDG